MIAALDRTLDEANYGGKAAQLSASVRRGLPVPLGVAVAWTVLDAFVAGEVDPIADIADALELSRGVAVRSSAVAEDSASTSFAGLHGTILNVRTRRGLADALWAVHASGRTEASRAYRRTHSLPSVSRMAAIVQVLVHARVAGVLFTRDPVTGEDARLVEASWGLGRVVMDGMVTPDSYRIARGGRIVDRRAGAKDVAILCRDAEEGVMEQHLGSGKARELCLKDDELLALDHLAILCEAVFPGAQDIEFAFDATTLHLLQRRAITNLSPLGGLQQRR